MKRRLMILLMALVMLISALPMVTLAAEEQQYYVIQIGDYGLSKNVSSEMREVEKALNILKYSSKVASRDIEKLLMSAIANWQAKNEGAKMEDAGLVVKEIYVDSGRVLKRIKPAPQGRGYRIRKRSNHVTLVVGSKENELVKEENA